MDVTAHEQHQEIERLHERAEEIAPHSPREADGLVRQAARIRAQIEEG